ncbi:testis specific protein Y-linked [Denticeps clupeoides]|uniref:testis specific protein Y-linked n=1 Tax=Denticeps clupeoides TaxID=299321 RepID=UPI0010A3F634|nr:protein SET-like [Denticeps clupeoides]
MQSDSSAGRPGSNKRSLSPDGECASPRSKLPKPGDESRDSGGPDAPAQGRSDSAAIAAAEALASLTRGDGDAGKEAPCSSRQAARARRVDRGAERTTCSADGAKPAPQTEAVAADSSSSLLPAAGGGDLFEEEDSLPGSSSTPNSSFASDNDDNEEGECAIVSVNMAPEIRQSVALLAQVQLRLDALEKKGARLHQRLELRLSRQRRPHMDQRGAITQSIPGFWVTALLNHPHLSAHIDENDEDALSYMTNLEIETFKNNKLGYRIAFHFKRNPYFQNNAIVKELHLRMGGSPVSFSNPILWHRGQSLVGGGEPGQREHGVYKSFFSWFGDHRNPSRDDIAQILKDDLYRNPLRYYLTPLWEPRENGSAPKVSGNGDECVVISDSDDDLDDADQREERPAGEDEDNEELGDNKDVHVAGSEDSGPEAGESSCEEKEEDELDVEETEEKKDEENVDVDEERDEES